jgi:arsenate-mycothiol transferase
LRLTPSKFTRRALPGDALTALSAESLAEVGADLSGERPKPIDPDLLSRADRVIVLGQHLPRRRTNPSP